MYCSTELLPCIHPSVRLFHGYASVDANARVGLSGEADDWTEGFADALGDDIEGRMEDAGVAGAGLAAMDNISRQREKRDAAVKLAAVGAFQAAAHQRHNVPSPSTPGVRLTSLERGA